MRDNLTALVDQVFLPVPLDLAAVVLQPFEQGIGSFASDFNVIVDHKFILASESNWTSRSCSRFKNTKISCETGAELSGIITELMAWEYEDLEIGVSSVIGTKPVKFFKVFITFVLTIASTLSSSSVDNKNGFSASSILSDGITWTNSRRSSSCDFLHLEVEEFYSSSELARLWKYLGRARVEKNLWRIWVDFHQCFTRVTVLNFHWSAWVTVDELDWGAWIAVYDLVVGVAVLIGLKSVLLPGLVEDHGIFRAI